MIFGCIAFAFIIFYPIVKKMVLNEVSEWWIQAFNVTISIVGPIIVFGLDWYINGNIPEKRYIYRSLFLAFEILVFMNIMLYVAKKLEEH